MKLERLRKLQFVAKSEVLDLFAGMYHSAFKGKGLEIEDLREYVAGDDIRSISWTKTAQMGRPIIKNFKEERDLTAIFIVDGSYSHRFGTTGTSKKERIAEIVALLSMCAMANHDRVGLILFSSKVEKYIPAKRGLKHGTRLIRELLSFEPEEKGTNLQAALSFLVKVIKKRVICFLLSDFIDKGYEKSFEIAAHKDDLIAIHVVDPFEKKLDPLGLVRFEDLESGSLSFVDLTPSFVEAAAKKEQERLKELQSLVAKTGASFLEIDTKKPFEPVLRAFFRQRKRRR
ncbi:MAG TPA: DUF58 domain-containing protein [Chlamydiales bacterium]|nr:DUF58 domain-containing protein [Chlamydiales bacterium]